MCKYWDGTALIFSAHDMMAIYGKTIYLSQNNRIINFLFLSYAIPFHSIVFIFVFVNFLWYMFVPVCILFRIIIFANIVHWYLSLYCITVCLCNCIYTVIISSSFFVVFIVLLCIHCAHIFCLIHSSYYCVCSVLCVVIFFSFLFYWLLCTFWFRLLTTCCNVLST